MNDIFKIQDYSNRMNLQNQNLNQLKEKLTPSSSNSQKTFSEYLQNEDLGKVAGKVSTSELRIKKDIQSETSQDPYRKKLYDASVEFESMFVKMMLKEMKNSVSKNKMIHGGYAEEIFDDMLTDERAKEISKNESIGLAEQIYTHLSSALPPLKA